MSLEFDVVELDEPAYPEVGTTAPDFERPLVSEEFWEDVSLSDLTNERPVLLVFHSMDGAFPATYLWSELQDRGFDEYDATVVGLSISSPYEHKSFLREQDMHGHGFRLFSDPANDVARLYGVVNDLDGMNGIEEPRPATFVIDRDRTVRYAWAATEWPEFPNYDELESAMAAVTGE